MEIDESEVKQMNGTYGFAYSGYTGVGIGVFRIDGDNLVGADLMGGKYRGTVTKDPKTGEISVSFGMFIPAGIFLVQGTSPLDFDSRREVSFTTPPDSGDRKSFEVYVAPGYINLMVKRIPDDYSWMAGGVKATIEPIGQ